MSTNHDLYLDLCAALAVGSIEPADRLVIEEHLAGGCAECRALLQDLSAPLEALALSLPPARPGRGHKARVMVAIAQSGPPRGPGAREARGETGRAASRPVLGVPGWAWITLAVGLGAALLGWWRASVLSERVDALREQLGACEQACGAADPDRAFSEFLARAPGARVLQADATPAGDAARRMRVAYDPARRRALVRLENFRAAPGRDFELWTLRGGAAVSEGLVRVNEQGAGVILIENVGDPKALGGFAISNEAAGGSVDRVTPGPVGWLAKTS